MCPYVDSQLRLHSPPESQRGSRVPVGQSQDVVVKHGLLEGLSWRPPHCTSWWAKAEVLNEVRQEDKLATFFPISKGWHPPYLHISPDCQISRQSWVTSSVSCELHMGKTCLHQLSIGIFDYTHTLLYFPNCLCDLTALAKLPLHSTYGQMEGGKRKAETIYMVLLDLQGSYFFLHNGWQRCLKAHLFHKELHCLMKNSCQVFHTQSCSNSFPMIIYLPNIRM